MPSQAIYNIIDVISYANHAIKTEIPKESLVRVIVGSFRSSVKLNNPSNALVLFPSPDFVVSKWGAEYIPFINSAKNIAEKMGLSVYFCDNSCNIAGSLLSSIEGSGSKIVFSTCDLLAAKLVSSCLVVENLVAGDILTEFNLKDKVGVSNEYVSSLISMIGDDYHNVKKVPKVGHKNAIKWISEFGDIERIFNNKDKIVGASFSELLKNELSVRESFFKLNGSYNAKLISEIDFSRKRINAASLYSLYVENKLYDWLPREIRERYTPNNNKMTTEISMKTIIDSEGLVDLTSQLLTSKSFSIYLDKNKSDDCIAIGISTSDSDGYFIPLSDGSWSSKVLSPSFVFSVMRKVMEDENVKKVSTDSKYLFKVMSSFGIKINGFASDLATLVYTMNSRDSYISFDELIREKMNISLRRLSSYKQDGLKVRDSSDLSLSDAQEYICERASILLKSNRFFYLAASQNHMVIPIYKKYELPLIPVLAQMESSGVKIDKDALCKVSNDLELRMKQIEEVLSAEYGSPINIDSPTQVSDLLFKKLSLPVIGTTGNGAASTSDASLKSLYEYHPAPALISEYRSLSKLKSTYADGIPKKICEKTGCIHSSFNQDVTATGRLSSSDPNLQNIPIKSKEGRRIRQAFIPSDGNYMMSADYSQIELRVLAHLSGDARLIAAFNSGEDIHRATAADVFGIRPADVTPEQRRSAKAINFGIIYGISASGLADDLGISKGQAANYISVYFKKYPEVAAYLKSLKERVFIDGYVSTISGRRLYHSKNEAQTPSGNRSIERAAMNAPMQGSASEIIKAAMIEISKWLIQEKMSAKMILQIHDELVFDVPPGEVKKLKNGVEKIMSQTTKLRVPLVVDIDIGKNLDQSHGLDIKEQEVELAV
ncbi:DNA polymerase I [Aeromonas sp. MrichA-1]|uniref:DNA polymerase I n=1 Tax=Aeromonas sp. MrichA-1 TaxID=2823362 RepID=UPI001B3446C3|nr:DNA polymerase I [Aeromonas sp. MrichA-1]MBP4081476.1 DNA polymerase I [Aeromonas sp. MrichA-1]